MAHPHAFPIRIYFEDTDFTGRVYHGAFVRFLERGRTEMLRAAGISHKSLAALDPPVFFTLRTFTLRFHAPAFIDDEVTVLTRPAAPPRATITMAQEIMRGETCLADAAVELCLINESGRPVRPPPPLRAAFA